MRHTNRDVHLRAYKGIIPAGIIAPNKTLSCIASSGWHQSSNYSWVLRNSLNTFDMAMCSTGYCSSGSTNYMYRGGMIAEARSGVLLTLPVKDPLGNKLLLVNDQFDTPRHRTQWRAMRAHFRKAMYEIVSQTRLAGDHIKIVKVPYDFLQMFKLQYNYVPSSAEMENLHKSIISQEREADHV
jgi:hypothetical protein